ncbi:MAG: hypothetical protein GXP08_18520 [Gammaproteobacteria bacterium]|nr:hypothetical protein [Gammaproteobacteria bacterium]
MVTLVLGIGNTLLTDEGVGVRAVQYLQDYYADLPDTEYLDGGTLFLLRVGITVRLQVTGECSHDYDRTSCYQIAY